MPDEQMIYLDPDDDLNRVTERLEAATRQRVILIVPLQTQMRSNVFWRLLYSRARSLGHDVTVVSADRQVRSVAKSAGFRIDDVPDSSKSSKGRIAHPSRSHPVRHVPRKSGTLPRHQPAARIDTAPERSSQQSWREPVSSHSPVGETFTGQVQNTPPLHIEDDEFDRPFEFRIDSSQAVPLSPSAKEQEEQDPYIPDYEKSRGILQSWQSSQAATPSQLSPTQFEPTSSVPDPSTFPRSSSLERDTAPPDPFDVFDERLPAPLPEQRGSAFVQEVDDGIPDIADKPDEIASEHKIEDLGEDEAGDESTMPQVDPQRQWPALLEDEPEEYEPRRVYGSRPRSSRSGTLSRRSLRDFSGDEEELAPIDERPTGAPILPPQPYAPTPAPQQPPPRQAAARANSGAIAQPQRPQRSVTMPPVAPPRAGAASRTGASPAARPAPQPTARPQPSRRGSRTLAVVLIVLLLLFLGGVGLFYYGTSAIVTLTLPAKSLQESKLTLLASTNPQDKAHNTVASQVLSYTASATGNAPATGTTPQGSSKASGSITFTNNGPAPVDIPNNTPISTPTGAGTSGVVFLTTADTLIQPNGGTFQIPIQAQSAGVSGNVGANKITVIPPDSLAAIATYNQVPISSLNLSVTNPSATTGGGVINVPSATTNDIAALKLKLHQQIQTQIKAWLQTQLHVNDQHGTLIPDVLGSANPLSQEILTQAPTVGQALSAPTIKGTLTVQIKVLVVRATDILSAAQQQLNQDALKMPSPYTVTTAKAPVTISKATGISSKDGTLLTITLNAAGKVIPYVDPTQLANLLAGKTEDQASGDISTSITSVQKIDITISPSFLHILPFRPEHIHIIVLPGTGPT